MVAPEPARALAPLAAAVPTARPGFVAAGRGMSVCHGCGAAAPTRRSQCAVCGAPIGTSLEAVPPRDDGCCWVQVRTELTCRQCGQRSPLDALDLDGSVTCGSCHSVQAFDTGAWEEALAHAHAVGDLAGPDLDGRNASLGSRNPFSSIGVTHTEASCEITGMTIAGGVMRTRNVTIAAAPGHPLCAQCGSPLSIDARGSEVQSACPGCGDRAHYRFPAQAASMAPGLVAAIGDELRVDRPEARLDATSAGMVIAVRCPSCGAGLEVLDGKHFVTCTYCKTHCRIPSRTLLALKQGGTKAEPWWLFFRGPSAKRRELAAPPPPPPRPAPAAKQSFSMLESAPVDGRAQGNVIAWALQVAIPMVVLALVGALFFGGTLLAWAQGRMSKEMVPPGSFGASQTTGDTRG